MMRTKAKFFLGFLGYFFDFWVIFEIFGQIILFLIKIMCFLSFSGQNDAESLWNFVKNLILNPKRVKLDQKSEIGHARTCPGGPVLTSKQRKYFFWDFTPFHFLWPVLTSKQRKYFFFEILHLSIFYDKYLLQTIGNIFIFSDFTSNHRKYFYFSYFTPFNFLLANLSFCYKIICFY